MIICNKCGGDNPLGRIFCDDCGAKLDMSNMGSASLHGSKRRIWIIRNWVAVAIAIGFVPVTMLVISAVPKSDPIGKTGTLPGGKRVASYLATLADTPNGQSRGVTITEAEINGYLEHFVRTKLGVDSATVIVRDQWIRFHLVDAIFPPIDLGPIKFVLQKSYDFDCVPYGGQLRVRRVTKGHLRLSGMFRNKAVRTFIPRLRSLGDWGVLADLSEIDAVDGEVHITIKR